MNVVINNRIRAARLEQGVTISEMARRLGVDAARVVRYEYIEIRPQRKTLQRLADALGVEPCSLLP